MWAYCFLLILTHEVGREEDRWGKRREGGGDRSCQVNDPNSAPRGIDRVLQDRHTMGVSVRESVGEQARRLGASSWGTNMALQTASSLRQAGSSGDRRSAWVDFE